MTIDHCQEEKGERERKRTRDGGALGKSRADGCDALALERGDGCERVDPACLWTEAKLSALTLSVHKHRAILCDGTASDKGQPLE